MELFWLPCRHRALAEAGPRVAEVEIAMPAEHTQARDRAGEGVLLGKAAGSQKGDSLRNMFEN